MVESRLSQIQPQNLLEANQMQGDINEDTVKIYVEQLEQPLEANMRSFFECPICLCILLEPVKCQTCDSHFCRSCLQTAREKQEAISLKCPKCRAGLPHVTSSSTANPLLVNMLSTLKIVCTDCSVPVLYDFFTKHVQVECLLRPIACVHCSEKLPRGNMETHVTIQCDKAPFVCEKCNYTANVTSQAHDCFAFFRQKVSSLQEENQLLKQEVAQLRAEKNKKLRSLPFENQNLLQMRRPELQLQQPVSTNQVEANNQEEGTPIQILANKITRIVSIDREEIYRLIQYMQGQQTQVCLHKKRRRFNDGSGQQLEIICFCGREDIQISQEFYNHCQNDQCRLFIAICVFCSQMEKLVRSQGIFDEASQSQSAIVAAVPGNINDQRL